MTADLQRKSKTLPGTFVQYTLLKGRPFAKVKPQTSKKVDLSSNTRYIYSIGILGLKKWGKKIPGTKKKYKLFVVIIMGDNLNSFVAFFFTFVRFCSILSLPANRYKCLQMSTNVYKSRIHQPCHARLANVYKRLQTSTNVYKW